MSAIRIQGLRKLYGTVRALDGLDLDVSEGSVFGFLGPNGAGKTTTLRILSGLTHPTGGRAWLAGQETGPESQALRWLGYLPEEPRFHAWMTPREFLGDFVGRLFGLALRESRLRASELLELVGLAEVGKRRIGGFSRGMRQRLGLAQALMNRPKVLLLDEPVSALDPAGRRDILALIGSLNASATVFMSTHILEDVERVCDTIGVIHHGRMVTVEAREALLQRYAVPAVQVVFSDSPETVAAWAAALRGKRFTRRAEAVGSEVRIDLDGSPGAGAELQQAVLGSGLAIQRFEFVRPSLEDVFLRLVEA